MSSRTLAEHLQHLKLEPEVITAWLNDSARPMDDNLLYQPAWWKDASRLKAVCDQLGFAPDIHDAFARAAAMIDVNDHAWWAILNLTARALGQANHSRYKAYARSGPPVAVWGMLGDMFKPLAMLTGLPTMIATHQRMGIDMQITRDTADDLPLWMNAHLLKHGRWGTCDSQGWFTKHLNGEIFALGRLQFELSTFTLPFVILINHQRQCMAMATADQSIRADGQFASCDMAIAKDAPDNWTTTFICSAEGFTGHPVDPQGFIRRETITLPASQWRILTRQEDDVIAIHIPARGKLDTAACEASLAQAESFFPKYFPHHRPRVFTCTSWLMDPQLCMIQQGQCNLAHFVKLFHSLPYPSGNSNQMFERVFDNQNDIATLPRDTSLRREIIAHMEAGGRWRSASGYRLLESTPY